MKLELRFPAELLRSPQLRRVLEAQARAIAAAAGPGMVVDSQTGRRRVRSSVRTATRRAVRGQAKDLRLTRALQGRRG